MEFANFLDDADDVVRYVKNEKLGFSVTYFEGGRPRQYFPDFVVAWQPASGAERFMVIETKGEIFPNTHLKSEAAKLWCDRMTAAGHEGDWSYLFVHQPVFNKALSNGVVALTDLATLIEGEPIKPVLELVPADAERVEKEAFETLLPVYSLHAAGGHFGSGEGVELDGWVEVAGLGKLSDGMFVAQVTGHSMEPLINDGDWCVFRADPVGSSQGKVVLAQYQGPADPETGGSYTVKRYRSEKVLEGDEWRHTRVLLEPENKAYEPIEVLAGDETDTKVIAEYIGALGGQVS